MAGVEGSAGGAGGITGAGSDPAWRALGTVVRVKTNYGDTFSGSVFAIDDESGMIVFQEELEYTTLKRNIRILRDSVIDEVEVLSLPTGPVDPLPPLRLEAIHAREKHAQGMVQREMRKVGRGVTPFAQALMNELGKTYKVAWKGTTILLADIGVRITEPYGPDECIGEPGSPALARIQTIVRSLAPKLERRVSDESGGVGGGPVGSP